MAHSSDDARRDNDALAIYLIRRIKMMQKFIYRGGGTHEEGIMQT